MKYAVKFFIVDAIAAALPVDASELEPIRKLNAAVFFVCCHIDLASAKECAFSIMWRSLRTVYKESTVSEVSWKNISGE